MTEPRLAAPETLTPRQREVHDRIASGARGRVEGPLRVWLHSPELADRSQALGAFCRYETRLPARLSELAILVTGAVWKSGFEWAVHAPIAERAGVSPDTIEAIRTGRSPSFSAESEDEAAVYEFSLALHRERRVDDKTYARLVAVIGSEGAVELVGILGYYTLISMTINTFAVPLPEGTEDPFPG
ncbi:carboxymuconolactone decarboxylase family protein [uncultured Jannaschia sp.]|uniref:carboxymuconolactone decarboxylase family protein n=1 Tax=uncultured Jannaschia sp. TaxID=293347 RepID=UPI00261D8CD2|nr:carboxymuconolactone decarboxylase family protein [uncultured Jannaschia sp.]